MTPRKKTTDFSIWLVFIIFMFLLGWNSDSKQNEDLASAKKLLNELETTLGGDKHETENTDAN